MGLLGALFPKKTLDNLTIEDLERETITLNEEERRLTKELEKTEEGKALLIQEGFKIKSAPQLKIQAQRVQVVEEQIKALSLRADSLFKEIRALNFLTIAKKNLLKSKEKSLLLRITDQYSVEEFAGMVTNIKVKLGVDDRKLEEIINVLGTSFEPSVLDPEVQRMMEMWQEGGEIHSIKEEMDTVKNEMDALNASQRKIEQEHTV